MIPNFLYVYYLYYNDKYTILIKYILILYLIIYFDISIEKLTVIDYMRYYISNI